MVSWQAIATRDPFLAGAIAARGVEWYDDITAESQADSVDLVGDQRSKFLEGWQFEIDEREQERIRERAKELDDMLEDAAGKGDPAAR